MFDIGFPELLLISVVALLVIGPERLPETIRSIALWVGRFRRTFANLRQEIEKEIGADEIRQQLHNETIMSDLEKSRDEIKAAADEVQSAMNGTVTELKSASSSLTEVPPKAGES